MLLHVLDFEGNLQCGIIEYGVVTLNHDQIEAVYTGMCKPDEPVSARDILLHDLRNEVLKDQFSFRDYRSFFYDLRASGVLAAHHAPVENGFLNKYWNVVPSMTSSYLGSQGSWGPWVDSRIVAQQFLDVGDYSLGNLVEVLGLSETLEGLGECYCPEGRRKAHSALYDAIASALVLLFFQKECQLTLDDLVRHSQSRAERKRQDFAQEELL